MAKVVLIGLENAEAHQLGRVLRDDNHVVESKTINATDKEVLDADIVFASGEGKQYLPLLKRVREKKPAMPFVVVTRLPEASDWIDALEAGATDYCSAPFETPQLRWLMETALPRPRTAVAA